MSEVPDRQSLVAAFRVREFLKYRGVRQDILKSSLRNFVEKFDVVLLRDDYRRLVERLGEERLEELVRNRIIRLETARNLLGGYD